MADTDDDPLEKRLGELEKKSGSSIPRWLRDTVTLATPVAVFALSVWVAFVKNDLEENRFEVQQVETAHQIISSLFNQNISEAITLHKLLNALMEDAKHRCAIGEAINYYMLVRYAEGLGQEKVVTTTDHLGEAIADFRRDCLPRMELAARSATTEPELNPFVHVVLISLVLEGPDEQLKFGRLIALAEEMAKDPTLPATEIWCSSTGPGYVALTAGKHRFRDARAIGNRVISAGWNAESKVTKEFYVTQGDNLYLQVWPGEHDPYSNPCPKA